MTTPREWNVPTLSTAVADWIAAGIISGRWTSGDRLREVSISEELGVSRAPVREAIRMLHDKGFVRHAPRLGAVVNEFSTKTVINVYQMRALIEAWICRESVPALQSDDIEQLKKLLAGMETSATDDRDAFFDAGWAFRQTLYSRCTNVLALELVDQLRGRLHSLPQVLRDDDSHVATTLATYRSALADAQRGDGEAVAATIATFMSEVGSYVCTRYATAAQRFKEQLKTRRTFL